MKLKVLGLVALAVALAGCSKLNKENYDKLEMGMSQQQVETIIGKPDNCSETLGSTSCIWGSDDGRHIKVLFMADKAMTFSNDGLK
ncbi:outer membrane protein assembly factor BamE [Alteromonas aestuariivivens]|uniref:Outer membrane protein assembly factor BamE n=1 Tax=Alteromonas aestuariivivens TaxID=1938339 RepID=A0A3D8MCX7_9ALTE|nr:outer membrane protein assembly factor BamE [Alteromonas aestuariivivens]RDV27533.1 outer membrane protein assembly factor BamE [Alteromonas aestuariivivens]